MRRTELLQELRKMRFEEAYESWNRGWLMQEEAGGKRADIPALPQKLF